MEQYRGQSIHFNCIRCGKCCRDLVHEIGDELKGPSLWPDEMKMFPREYVLPSFSMGQSKDDNLKIVWMYQLNKDSCPNLEVSNICKVYEKRPLSCRSFPLIGLENNLASISYGRDCDFIKRVETERGRLDYLFSPKTFNARDSWIASNRNIRLVENKIIASVRMGLQTFSYDLRDNQWKKYD